MMITGSQKKASFLGSLCAVHVRSSLKQLGNAIETIETFLEWSSDRGRHSRPSRAVMKRARQKKETTNRKLPSTHYFLEKKKEFLLRLSKAIWIFNERKRHLLTAKSAIEARITSEELLAAKVHRINCSPSTLAVSSQFSRIVRCFKHKSAISMET